jgi:hypothetical protein
MQDFKTDTGNNAGEAAASQHKSMTKLLQDIAQPTQEQQPQQTHAPALDEFEDDDPGAADTGNNGGAGEQQAEKKINEKMLKSTAKFILNLFDFFQHKGFKTAGRFKEKRKLKRLYGDDALDKMEAAITKAEMQTGSNTRNTDAEILQMFSPEEIGMLRIRKEVNEFMEGLPLTDDEKEQLMEPLIEILKIKGGAIPPEWILIGTILQVTGARTTELLMI